LDSVAAVSDNSHPHSNQLAEDNTNRHHHHHHHLQYSPAAAAMSSSKQTAAVESNKLNHHRRSSAEKVAEDSYRWKQAAVMEKVAAATELDHTAYTSLHLLS
jgi:hypothetical protein